MTYACILEQNQSTFQSKYKHVYFPLWFQHKAWVTAVGCNGTLSCAVQWNSSILRLIW